MASGRLRPWIGSIVVHGAVIAALALAAVQWRTPPQPEQLAIEGNVVRYEDLPSSVKAGKPLREPAPEAKTTPEPALAPPPEPRVQPEPEPPTPPPPDPAVLQRQADEAAARAKAEAQAKAAQKLVAEQNAAQKRAADEQRQLEAKRKAEEQRELEEQRKQAALEARQKQAEQEKAAVAAKARAAKEADLRRQLEAEEAGEALARSGVVDEYRTLLIQTIERNWIRPASARAGLECTLNVTQATGGTVLDVKIGDCNGDQAVRESVANAVYRSSPLPAPRDTRAFERRLVIVFKPTE